MSSRLTRSTVVRTAPSSASAAAGSPPRGRGTAAGGGGGLAGGARAPRPGRRGGGRRSRGPLPRGRDHRGHGAGGLLQQRGELGRHGPAPGQVTWLAGTGDGAPGAGRGRARGPAAGGAMAVRSSSSPAPSPSLIRSVPSSTRIGMLRAHWPGAARAGAAGLGTGSSDRGSSGVSLDPQGGGHPLQLGQPAAEGHVHRNREMVPPAQVVRDERGELTGPDLEERPDASVVHRGQGGPEPDRLLQLPVQELEALLLIGRERRRDRRRPDGVSGRPRPVPSSGCRTRGGPACGLCATACPRRAAGPARRPVSGTGCARPW